MTPIARESSQAEIAVQAAKATKKKKTQNMVNYFNDLPKAWDQFRSCEGLIAAQR
jgi:hypothetical protein